MVGREGPGRDTESGDQHRGGCSWEIVLPNQNGCKPNCDDTGVSTTTGVSKAIEKGMRPDLPEEAKRAKLDLKKIPKDEYGSLIKDLTGQMELASANLEFEKAAELRDLIAEIRSKM